jgi:hypothetical protein
MQFAIDTQIMATVRWSASFLMHVGQTLFAPTIQALLRHAGELQEVDVHAGSGARWCTVRAVVSKSGGHCV